VELRDVAYAACNLHNKRCAEQHRASVVTSFTHTADIDSHYICSSESTKRFARSVSDVSTFI